MREAIDEFLEKSVRFDDPNRPKFCRELYAEAETLLRKYPDIDKYSAGFIHGQVEKVFLGACNACMSRCVGKEYHIEFINDLCKIYKLSFKVIGLEVWIHRGVGYVMSWELEKDDSPRYHMLRAVICGIPPDEIDLEFHERQIHQ